MRVVVIFYTSNAARDNTRDEESKNYILQIEYRRENRTLVLLFFRYCY
jgi:hypothetical protein